MHPDSNIKTIKSSTENSSLSNLIDSIPALIASIDCNMTVQYVNKPFEKWFFEGGKTLPKSFQDIIGKSVFDQLQRHLGKVLVGKPASLQVSIGTEKGFEYLDVTLSPEFDSRRKVKSFIFHATSATEKLNNQRALSDYFENASIGLHWVNADGIITWANPAELHLLGYTEEEYIGHHISEFHVSQNAISEILSCLRRNETLRNYEAELLCKDGSKRHVAINSSVLWEGDQFVHTRCFTIDITEQKLASLAVKESEERFKMMANLVPLVIWTTDEQGDCNFLSIRWKEITGKNFEDGLGNRWLNFLHPEDREKIRNSWFKSLTEKKGFEAKFRYLNSPGVYTMYYANASPRYNSTGDFVGYIGIFQDISSQELIKSSLERIVLERTEDLTRRNDQLRFAENALKEKNLELEKINKELSSFAHIASHDLQEPLRKIQTFSSRLLELEGDKFSEKGKQFLDRIESSTLRMRSLIEDLLTYSKTNEDGRKIESVDLNKLLQEVVSEFEVKIEEKQASVEIPKLPVVPGIKYQLHQLFSNLLSNALKFSREGARPQIVLKAEVVDADKVRVFDPTKKYHHISIADNGIGFEPEFNEKIFEIFHRLHSKSRFEGTGIGLAICKKIIENHNGIMKAEGKPDQGAVFHIYLPAG